MYQDYFLEICWFVETSRIGEGGLPGKVFRWFFCGVVHTEKIYFVPRFCLSSANNVQSHLKLRVPALCSPLSLILRKIAFVVLRAKRRTVAIRIGDISKEELAGGTDFDLKIVVRVAIKSRDENFHYIFLVERIVAVLVSRDDFLIDAGPVYEETRGIMTNGCSSGVVKRSVYEREMQHDRRQRSATRHVEGNSKLQYHKCKEIFHNKDKNHFIWQSQQYGQLGQFSLCWEKDREKL